MHHQTLNLARKTLYIEGNPEEALKILSPMYAERDKLGFADVWPMIELMGTARSQRKEFDEATELYLSIKDFYEAGYNQMLKGNLDSAVAHWKNLIYERQNHWCVSLYGLATGNLTTLPTFLQIRNHYEADIILLARAGQKQLADNLILNISTLSDINYESYKFAGRAFFHVGDYEKAGWLLLRGQRALPNDPEIYYHLGQYYYAIGKMEESALMLQQCILISPMYTPAKELHTKIQQQETKC
jgi:predicted Zn-dependent protease